MRETLAKEGEIIVLIEIEKKEETDKGKPSLKKKRKASEKSEPAEQVSRGEDEGKKSVFDRLKKKNRFHEYLVHQNDYRNAEQRLEPVKIDKEKGLVISLNKANNNIRTNHGNKMERKAHIEPVKKRKEIPLEKVPETKEEIQPYNDAPAPQNEGEEVGVPAGSEEVKEKKLVHSSSYIYRKSGARNGQHVLMETNAHTSIPPKL